MTLDYLQVLPKMTTFLGPLDFYFAQIGPVIAQASCWPSIVCG
ncbi:hypothetical protein DSM3645_12196 [Blastopirellula marina DSM 3645]|uniref:Uncharacterized protein n=1 Tax=Blastopirellula marina DSM 3645 TaxID=314230 RepID=A3ZRK9_9BACT|nr:hypothetical protein DSM3645_12196 [Blastopirellula marina DSM 3645]